MTLLLGDDMVEHKSFKLAVLSTEHRRIRLGELSKQSRYATVAIFFGVLAVGGSFYVAATRNHYFSFFAVVQTFLLVRASQRFSRRNTELKLLQMLEIQDAVSGSQKVNQ
jgi:hypothetical protein